MNTVKETSELITAAAAAAAPVRRYTEEETINLIRAVAAAPVLKTEEELNYLQAKEEARAADERLSKEGKLSFHQMRVIAYAGALEMFRHYPETIRDEKIKSRTEIFYQRIYRNLSAEQDAGTVAERNKRIRALELEELASIGMTADIRHEGQLIVAAWQGGSYADIFVKGEAVDTLNLSDTPFNYQHPQRSQEQLDTALEEWAEDYAGDYISNPLQ